MYIYIHTYVCLCVYIYIHMYVYVYVKGSIICIIAYDPRTEHQQGYITATASIVASVHDCPRQSFHVIQMCSPWYGTCGTGLRRRRFNQISVELPKFFREHPQNCKLRLSLSLYIYMYIYIYL